MKQERRDAIIAKVEEQMIVAGAKGYDEGMQTVGRLLDAAYKHFDPLRTREQFAALLDSMPEPSWLQMKMFLGTLNFVPQIVRFGIAKMATIAEDELPAIPRGRPGLGVSAKHQIVAYISRKQMIGSSLEQAKKSAALHFRQSESTIQRTWDSRGDFGDVDFRSVLKFLESDFGREDLAGASTELSDSGVLRRRND